MVLRDQGGPVGRNFLITIVTQPFLSTEHIRFTNWHSFQHSPCGECMSMVVPEILAAL